VFGNDKNVYELRSNQTHFKQRKKLKETNQANVDFFPPRKLFVYICSFDRVICLREKKDVKSVKIKLENQNKHNTGHNLEEK